MSRLFLILTVLVVLVVGAGTAAAQTDRGGAALQSLQERVDSLEHDVQRMLEAILMLRARGYIVDDELRIPLNKKSSRMASGADYQMHLTQIEIDWLLSLFDDGPGFGATPDFQNCTARCRRRNCQGKTGTDWIDCAVACDRQCRSR